MITFFRRIRQKLIDSGSLSRYLLYAIGEILLVVIGILIALQINNWNEDRKEYNLSQSILSQIEEKVTRDTTLLNGQLNRFDNILESARWVIQEFEKDSPYSPKMDTAFARISIFSFLEADYSAYEYLQNEGIGIIKDRDLRESISDYYGYSEFIEDVDNYFELNKYYRQEIYPKYFKRYRYGSLAVPKDYEELKKSTEFRVVVDMSFNDANFYYSQTLDQKERAIELLGKIKAELAK